MLPGVRRDCSSEGKGKGKGKGLLDFVAKKET